VDTALLRALPIITPTLIASGNAFVAKKGAAVAVARASAKSCSTGATFDVAQLLPGAEDLANAAFWGTNASTIARTTKGDAPKGPAFTLTGTSGSDSYMYSASAPAATSTAQRYTASIWARVTSGASAPVTMYVEDSSTFADLGGTITPTLTTTWQLYTFTTTQNPVVGHQVDIFIGGVSGNWSVELSEPKLEYGTSATPVVPGGDKLLASVAVNMPCVESQGLLMEPAGSNLLARSKALASAPWASSGAAAAVNNAAVGPDGSLSATQLTITSGTTAAQAISQAVGCAASTTYTFSVWLWVPTGTASVRISRTNAVTWATATVSPTLTLSTTPTRYSLTFTTGASDVNSGLVIGSEAKTPFGATLNTPFYASDAQLELGPVATSNIATTSTTASRLEDDVTWGGTLPVPNTAGSVSVTYTPMLTGAANGYTYLFGGSGNWLYSNAGDPALLIYDGSLATLGSGYTAGVARHYVSRWDATSRALVNVTDGTQASGPALVNTFATASFTSGPALGWLRDVCISSSTMGCQ